MKFLRQALALLLAAALGVQPAFAANRAGAVGAASVSAAPVLAAPVSLPALPPASLSFTALPPGLSVPSFTLPPAAVGPASATAAPVPGAASASLPPAAAAPVPAAAAKLAPSVPGAKPSAADAVARISGAAAKAVAGVEHAAGPQAREQASQQFAQLTGELTVRPAGSDAAVPASSSQGAGAAPLAKSSGAPAAKSPETGPPAPAPAPAPKKSGWFQVFSDPARNRAFWRYVSGYGLFLFGFEMYVVGMPYLISSLTTNSLNEHKDKRANDAEAVKELIRSNRSLSRVAHWVAQGISYAAIPLFTRNAEQDGPRKWLVRSMLLRAAALAGVPLLFFATGVISLHAAMWILFGLVAAQSFFQGVSVTTEGAATTKMLGDKSVTAEERTRANSVLTVVAAVIAIIGPAVAGQIAGIGPVMGKHGVGGAVIYGIYAAVMALTGLIYATIKMFGGKGSEAAAAGAKPGEAAAEPAPKGLAGTLKALWTSITDGTRMMLKDRLLRTMVLLSTMSALFSDPLVFNVLPEYVENLVAKNPGTLGAIMGVPGLGWFLKTLVATPMGNFALMVVMASVGSIVAAALMKPLTRLFTKLGFKTDEALTIPFYFIAALEFPLFLLMINMPTMLGAVALYGLQALSVGFIGIAIQGLYQKNLGGRKDGDVNKILAADSLVGIAAAIVSTVVYGFVLTGIAIHTSMIIAAVATGAVALLRLTAPFLAFSRNQRRPPPPTQDPPPKGPVPPAHAMPSTGDHNGPNSILSTHL